MFFNLKKIEIFYLFFQEYNYLSILNKKKAMNEDKQFRVLLAVTSVVWLILVGVLIII